MLSRHKEVGKTYVHKNSIRFGYGRVLRTGTGTRQRLLRHECRPRGPEHLLVNGIRQVAMSDGDNSARESSISGRYNIGCGVHIWYK